MKIFRRGVGVGAVLLHSLLIISVHSFQQSMTLISRTGHSFECHPHCFRDKSILNLKEDSLNGDEDDVEEFSGIPQLPAFGASSFSNPVAMTEDTMTGSCASNSNNADGEAFGKAAFVSPKFKLQYTCNICETRNSHMVSRLGKAMVRQGTFADVSFLFAHRAACLTFLPAIIFINSISRRSCHCYLQRVQKQTLDR